MLHRYMRHIEHILTQFNLGENDTNQNLYTVFILIYYALIIPFHYFFIKSD